MWKYQVEKGERMAYDFDGQTMAPFKHEIVHIDEPFPQVPHSISILTVHLLNSSYFTNYSIFSVKGNCYVNVKINLKETGMLFVDFFIAHYYALFILSVTFYIK